MRHFRVPVPQVPRGSPESAEKAPITASPEAHTVLLSAEGTGETTTSLARWACQRSLPLGRSTAWRVDPSIGDEPWVAT